MNWRRGNFSGKKNPKFSPIGHYFSFFLSRSNLFCNFVHCFLRGNSTKIV